MPERRFDHVAELKAVGLAPPDDTTMNLLWQIVDEGVLGASRHVVLGHQLVLHLIDSTPDSEAGLARARMAAEFIARTRGQDTPVIGNSLMKLLEGLEEATTAQQLDMLRSRVTSWDRDSAERKKRLIGTAVRHLSGAERLMAFDYSSTVAAIAIALAKLRPATVFIVPESRTIEGGRRYLNELVEAGLTVKFIPDAAIDHALDTCDAALFGVETLMADGSFLNTIGSRMIARLAALARVEIYGCTDFMKLDLRSYDGHRPLLPDRSYDDVLLGGGAETMQVGS